MHYYFSMFLLAIVGLVLESTFFVHFTIAGVKPDLLLILIIFNSLFHGPIKGTFFGFSLGLFEDILLGTNIGMNALAKGLTAFASAWFMKGAFRENLLVPVISLFLGTLLNGVAVLTLGKMVGLNWEWNLFYWKVIPVVIYNTCLVPFIYSPFYKWVVQDKEQQTM